METERVKYDLSEQFGPYKESKKRESALVQIAKEANAHGMSYGQWVAYKERNSRGGILGTVSCK